MAWNPRAVEELTFGDGVLVKGFCGNVKVLHHTGEIAEANVNELDIFFLDELHGFAGIAEHVSSVRAGRTLALSSCSF